MYIKQNIIITSMIIIASALNSCDITDNDDKINSEMILKKKDEKIKQLIERIDYNTVEIRRNKEILNEIELANQNINQDIKKLKTTN